MAGHSKFKNIMHRKGAQDKRRSQLFTRLSRDILMAAKAGLPDPLTNARLRLAIANARAESMPRDNIERVLKRAAGGDTDTLEEVRYEGFAPGGVGIIIEALTDNRNRTAGEVRAAFNKNGGNLGTPNAVAVSFERIGEILYPLAKASEDQMMEAAIEAGANDCATDEETHQIICDVTGLAEVSAALSQRFGDPQSAKIIWRPLNTVTVEGENVAVVLKLVDALDDLDDVQNVYANFELSDADIAKLDR